MTALETLNNDARFRAYCHAAVHKVLSNLGLLQDENMANFAMEVAAETLHLAFNGDLEVARLREENRVLMAQVINLLRYHPSASGAEGIKL